MVKFIAFFVLFSFQQAFACSCMEWQGAAEMMAQADAVFLAIPAADSVEVEGRSEFGAGVFKTPMSIVRSYKNANSKSVDLYTSTNVDAGCGIQFDQDEGMSLIFAYTNDQGQLETSTCSMDTAESKDVIKMLRELNDL